MASIFWAFSSSLAQYNSSFEVADRNLLITEGWHSFQGFNTHNSNPRTGTYSLRGSPNAVSTAITPMFDFGSTAGGDVVSVWYRGSSNYASATVTISLADATTGAAVAGSSASVTGISTVYQQLSLNVTESGVYRLRIEGNTTGGGGIRPVLDDFVSPLSIYVAPLPVTLLYFKGTIHPQNALLNWATATEKNNSHFEIYHSEDLKNFTLIGRVDGAGNSLQTRFYEFIDTQIREGVNYYKLEQVDFNGKREEFNIIHLIFTSGSLTEQWVVYNQKGERVFSGVKSDFFKQAEKGKIYVLYQKGQASKIIIQ